MAILSKLVSGLASVVTNKALYVAGIIVVAIAKPACEYTVKLILRDTSAALADTESSIETKLAATEDAIKKAFEESQKMFQEYIRDKINEMNQFTMNEIEGMNAQISILMNEIKTNQSTILNKNKDDIVNKIIGNNEKAFSEMQMQLPDKDYIESTAKKYAMYLHEEHVEIMNISRDDDTISIASTRAESVQMIPTPKDKEFPVPRLGPIKFAPPPLSGVPKLRKPLSARSVN
jgi:hypothetical protein